MENIKKILDLLSSKEKKKLIILMLITLLTGFFDLIGVASIVPFITVLTNPVMIETNYFLKLLFNFSNFFGVETNEQFLFFLGIIVFLILIFSLSFNAFNTYLQLRFIQMRQWSIGNLLLKKYLSQSYTWFLTKNSSDFEKVILSEVNNIISGGLTPVIRLVTKSILIILLLTLLILTNPKLAIITGLIFLFFYGCIYFLIRNLLKFIGYRRLQANKERFKIISEAFGAFKEIKSSNLGLTYINNFSYSSKNYANHQANSQILVQLPRFFLEAIAFGGLILVILYLMSSSGNLNSALPIISLYAFAGYRLLPAIQEIFSSLGQLKFTASSINEINENVQNLKTIDFSNKKNYLNLEKNISLENICYSYPNSDKMVLKDININIPAFSKVAIIGKTGSGKTTLLDIMLGLLDPKSGSLKVDGQNINLQNIKSWQNSIGYVPQNVYIADTTIASNIAFGLNISDINYKKVEKVSSLANLHHFVSQELPLKYQTIVGERGINISGGQRQRIGIARALYNNPQVLILDEATNSLDFFTEQNVMQSLNQISEKLTIILITHNLNFAKKFDNIFILDNGKITNKGQFVDLIK